MAFPVADSYTVGTGQRIVAGRYAIAENISLAFTDGTAGEHSLAADFPDVGDRAALLYVDSGVLPNYVTLDPLGKRLIYDGTAGLQAGTATIKSWLAAPSVRFTNAVGTIPVYFAVPFPKGKVFGSLGTNQPNLSVATRATWNDGSVKHAMVVGTCDATARVTFNTIPPSGAVMTTADIQAAAPSAYVDLGVYGGVSLASLLAAPFETWVATNRFIECHYRHTLQSSGTTELAVEFQVRLWHDGSCWVRAVVENSCRKYDDQVEYVFNGSVTIGGSVTYTYTDKKLYHNTFHIHEGWIGAVQHDVIVVHDREQFAQFGLPYIGMTSSIAEATLAALHTTYTPDATLGIDTAMGAPGEAAGIGVLPHWDACYLVSGDARAYRSVLANGKAAASFGTLWRHNGRNLIPSDFPTQTTYTSNAGATYFYVYDVSSSEYRRWSGAHAPSLGFMAYFLTGDACYADIMVGAAMLNFQSGMTSAWGSGTARTLQNTQERTCSWALRTIGHAAAFLPDGMAEKSDMRAWLKSNIELFYSDTQTAPASAIGVPRTFSTYNVSQIAEEGFTSPVWQHHYWQAALGAISDIEPLGDSDMTTLHALRTWMYRGAVGMFGDSSGWHFTEAGRKWVKYSDEVVPLYATRRPNQLFQDWATIFTKSWTTPPATTTALPVYSNTLDTNTTETMGYGPENVLSYWAIARMALSYAVKHGAEGAAEADARLMGATNYSLMTNANWSTAPKYGIRPPPVPVTSSKTLTTVVNQPVSSWAPTAGQIKQISYNAGTHPLGAGAVLSEIAPNNQDFNPYKPDGSIYYNGYGFNTWYGYCGAAFNSDTRQIVHYGSGHVSCNITAPLCFDLKDLRWKWLDDPLPFDSLGKLMGVSSYPTQAQVELYYPPEQYNYDWGDVSGDWAGWPVGFGQPGKIQPLPTHTYSTTVCIPAAAMGNTKGGFLMFGSYEGVINASGNANGTHLFDFDTQTWTRGNNVWPGGSSYGRGAYTDPVTGKVIVFGSWSTLSFRVFDPATKLWTTRTATGTPAYTSSGDHHGNLIHEEANLYIIPGGRTASDLPCTWEYVNSGVTYKFHVAPVDGILGSGSFALSVLTVNVAGLWPLNDLGNNVTIGWTYCPEDGCLYAINGVHGSNKYWRLAPPVGAVTQSDYLTGTWTLTDHTFTSGTLQSPGFTRSQMYNRMKWDQASKSFVFWVNSYTGPVQAWRPEGIS